MAKLAIQLDIAKAGQLYSKPADKIEVEAVPLSVAIREGGKLVDWQAHNGEYLQFGGGACRACALGAAAVYYLGREYMADLGYQGAWLNIEKLLVNITGGMLSHDFINPMKLGEVLTLRGIVWLLNDAEHWSFDQIADWVEKAEEGWALITEPKVGWPYESTDSNGS